jgi:hypothetical protein
MPKLSRYFIKFGLLYFVGGLLIGTIMLAQPVFNLPPEISVLRPVYLHWLTIGWLTQLIMGVAYWMFPKYSREQPRGKEYLGWATIILLNSGLILRSIGEPAIALYPDAGLGWLLALAAVLLFLASWTFIFNTWARVKER